MNKPYDTKSGKELTPMADFLRHLANEQALYRSTIVQYVGEDGFNKLLSDGVIIKHPNLEDCYMITQAGEEIAKNPKK